MRTRYLCTGKAHLPPDRLARKPMRRHGRKGTDTLKGKISKTVARSLRSHNVPGIDTKDTIFKGNLDCKGNDAFMMISYITWKTENHHITAKNKEHGLHNGIRVLCSHQITIDYIEKRCYLIRHYVLFL